MPRTPQALAPPLVSTLILAGLLAAGAGDPEASPRADGSLEARLAAEVRRSEYRFSRDGDGWSAPNRAHGLRTRTTAGAVEIVSRVEGASGWSLTLNLTEWGRRGCVEPFRPGPWSADGSRLERAGAGLAEWLANRPGGLKHGFTLLEPPKREAPVSEPSLPEAPEGGGGSGRPLVLKLALGGSLRARLSGDRLGISLAPPAGRALLKYDGLAVRDAAGRPVPAHMELQGSGLLLVIDDAGAGYPLEVDPLLTSAAWTATGTGDDLLGYSISTAGDVNGDGYSDVIVGATYFDGPVLNTGAAFVFHGGPSGPSATADWSAVPSTGSSEFGRSVSAAGDVNGDGYGDVIVGAPLWTNGSQFEGKAFLWLGGPGGLGASGDETTADWSYEGGQQHAFLGMAVSEAGDVNGNGNDDVIIGAPGWSNGEDNEGRALLFLGVSGGLASLPAWTAESNQSCPVSCTEADFGAAVAGAGDVNADGYDDILVGAPGYDDGSQQNEGHAFLWLGYSGFGTGPDGTPLNAAWWGQSNQDFSGFGRSVAPAGDVDGDGYADVIIGSPWWSGTEISEGAAFVWRGGPLGLGPVGDPGNAWWMARGNQAGAGFGERVGSAGDVNGDGFADIFVGAGNYDTTLPDDGGSWLWLGGSSGPSPASGLPANADWSATSGQSGSAFGSAVSAAGDVDGDGFGDLMVSAHLWEEGASGASNGKVWIYRGAPGGPSLAADAGFEGNQAGATFGLSVASAGDVNGDGFDEVIVGAPMFDNGEANEGQAFLYLGSGGGLFLSPSWTAQGDQDNALLGQSVSSAGDVNGDGYGDLVIGVPGYVKSLAGEGGVFVWFGGPASLPDPAGLGPEGRPGNADWEDHGGINSAQMGLAVASAGDVNGDGYGDIIVGAPFLTNGETEEGKAWIYPGSPAGPQAAFWSREGGVAGAQLGRGVASAGDVNADGFSDVLVGAPFHSGGQTGEGRAELYLGSGSGPSLSPDWSFESEQDEAHAGMSVASAGDVDGDGFSDWMVGIPDYDLGGVLDEGIVSLWYGTAGPLPQSPGWFAEGAWPGARLGISAASAGDVNLDGYADVIAGAPGFDNAETDQGYVAIWLGGPGGPMTPASRFDNDWLVEGAGSNTQLGLSVASAGDVNGDGFPEVIAGGPFLSWPETTEGGAWLYMGNGVEGLHRIPVQARADDTAGLGPLGRSESMSSFTLRGLGRSSAGRAMVRLQWEVKPLGQPFDGMGLQSGALFTDTGDPDFLDGSAEPLSEAASGLDGGELYHWRLRIASDNPRHPWTPWMSPSFNSPQETDLRTEGCVDRDGDGYGIVLDPNCPGGAVLDCNDGHALVNPGQSELCDGLDNNCDGATDEGNPGGGAPCLTGLPGICEAGTTLCRGGSVVCVANRSPEPEQCDGLDNNCDGVTDEGNPEGGGSCDTGLPGICAPGTETCLAGSLTCVQNATPTAETCNGLDDDCDGSVPPDEVDGDGDGVSPCQGDCDDKEMGLIAPPGPVTGLTVTPLNPGYRYMWDSQDLTAGSATLYDVYSGPVSDIRPTGDFTTGACAGDDVGAGDSWDDLGPDPPPGEAFYFMFRGQNSCPGGTGSFGNNWRDAGNAGSAAPCG